MDIKLAVSRSGHDKDSIYVIVKEEADMVYLADGKLKPLEKPKKKKWKHIQIMKRIPVEFRDIQWEHVKNEEIRHSIKAIGLQNDRR